jgi:hypothetical protein
MRVRALVAAANFRMTEFKGRMNEEVTIILPCREVEISGARTDVKMTA